MKKVLKSLLLFGGIAAVSFQGIRLYRMFKVVQNLEKNLPEYLNKLYGETPEVNCSITANVLISITVTVTFSPEALANNEGMEKTIKQYIIDNYPLLASSKLAVIVVDHTMSKAEIIQKYNPKLYKMFGKIIEKKMKEEETTEVHEEPTD